MGGLQGMEGPRLAGALQALLSALHQELHSHKWLVATLLDRADREHSSIRKVLLDELL